MSARDSEINRDIDTAEGHIRQPWTEDGEDAGVRNTIRHTDALDDEAEGHAARFIEDAGDAGVRLS